MTWTISASLATVDAGTTETLAGLAAASVSGGPAIESFASSDHTTYVLTGSRQLRVDGTLVIDQRVETLVCQSTTSNPGVLIRNNGTLTLGRAVESTSSALASPGTSYGFGTALVIGKDGPHCCANGALRVDNGGTLNIFEATIKMRGCVELPNGCNLNVQNGSIVNTTPTGNPGVTRIRLSEGTGIDVDGLTTYNIQLDWLDDEVLTRFDRYAPRDIPTGAQVALGADGAARTFRSVPDYRETSACFCNVYQGRKDLQVINAEIGSATVLMSVQSLQNTGGFTRTTITATAAGSTDSVINVAARGTIAVGHRIRIGVGPAGALRTVTAINGNALTIDDPLDAAPGSGVAVSNVASHGGRVFHELRFDISDEDGNAVQGARVWMRDTDNGQRIFSDTANIDELADRTYEETADATGLTPIMTVLTGMWYRQDSVGGIPVPNGNEILDVRGKTGVAGEDLFDARVYAYGYIPVVISNIELKGVDPALVSWTLFEDPFITESDKAVVDAWDTLGKVSQVYDRVQAEKADDPTFGGLGDSVVTRDGTTLDAGSRDVVLSRTAASTIAVDATTITIKADATFFGGIRTTGTVTVGVGITVTESVQDSTGVVVTVVGFTPGHRAVAAAWPANQGPNDRRNIITAANYVTRNDASIVAATNTLASATTDFRGFRVNGTLILSGWDNDANNGSFTIATIATDGRSCTLTRDSGNFVNESAGATVDIEDGTTTAVRLRLAANSRYYFVADAVSYLRSSALLIDTGITTIIQGSLRRIVDTQGNDLIPVAADLTQDENNQLALIDYDHGTDRIMFGATAATNEYTFRAVARAIELGQSSASALSNPYICTITQGAFMLESSTSRMLARAVGVSANLVPDLSSFQFSKVGADDQKDFVDFSTGAIIVNAGVPAIVSLSGVAEADFHRYLDTLPGATKAEFKSSGDQAAAGMTVLELWQFLGGVGGGRIVENGDDSTMLDVHSLVDDNLVATIPKFVGNSRAAGATVPTE